MGFTAETWRPPDLPASSRRSGEGWLRNGGHRFASPEHCLTCVIPADRTNPPLPGTHSRRRPMDVQDPTADAEGSIPRTALIVTLATAFALLIAVVGLQPVGASAATTGFVQRCGIHFCLDGHTYYFAGANSYDLFSYGSGSGDTETQFMDKARIDAHLAEMAADGVTVVRATMFNHQS